MWRAIRDGAFVAEPRERAVWRASVKPSDAPAALAALGEPRRAPRWTGGGLIWFSTDPTREAAAACARRARPVPRPCRTDPRRRRAAREVDVFTPLTPALALLTRGVKQSLDPEGLFNPGRMYADL